MITNCFTNFIQIIDIPDLVAAFLSFLIYVLSFMGSKNEMYTPPDDSNINFPNSIELKLSVNILYIYIVSCPLIFLLLKIAANFFFTNLIQNFRYFTFLWVSAASTFLSLAIVNYFRYFIGFPKPDTYDLCNYDFYSKKCKKKIINKSDIFSSYPSFESVIVMSTMSNLAFAFQNIFCSFNSLYVILIFLGIYVGTLNIKTFKSHPADVTASLLIGFLVSHYFWNNSKKRILIHEENIRPYQSIYN